MKTARSIFKKMRQAGHAVLTPFMVMLLCWMSMTQLAPKTVAGLQCPTAPVQLVKAPVKSACGCVIGYVARAPKPGEPGFLQCRCAEKRSSPTASAVTHIIADAEVPLPTTWLIAPRKLAETLMIEPTAVTAWHSHSEAPLTPPPCCFA